MPKSHAVPLQIPRRKSKLLDSEHSDVVDVCILQAANDNRTSSEYIIHQVADCNRPKDIHIGYSDSHNRHSSIRIGNHSIARLGAHRANAVAGLHWTAGGLQLR